MKVTFRNFDKEYREYFGIKGSYNIASEDMEEVIWNLYDSDNFEVDYQNKMILIKMKG